VGLRHGWHQVQRHEAQFAIAYASQDPYANLYIASAWMYRLTNEQTYYKDSLSWKEQAVAYATSRKR
jgi:hypothetical protein